MAQKRPRTACNVLINGCTHQTVRRLKRTWYISSGAYMMDHSSSASHLQTLPFQVGLACKSTVHSVLEFHRPAQTDCPSPFQYLQRQAKKGTCLFMLHN